MDKELEIRRMLTYLAKKVYYIRQISDGKLILEQSFGIDNKSLPRRSNNHFTIDFNKKTIDVYSYDESYHNGDHENYINTILPWELLLTGYDAIKLQLRPHLEKDALDDIKNKLIDQKLSDILKG